MLVVTGRALVTMPRRARPRRMSIDDSDGLDLDESGDADEGARRR